MLKFIHLTDLHLTGTGELHLGYDTAASVSRALAHIAARHRDAAFLVVTGDLANWGEAAAYRRLAEMLADFPIPVQLMIGNHDSRDNFLDIFGDRHPYELPYIQYHRDLERFRLLFCDSTTPGTHGGALTADRLAWINAKISETDLPVLLFMHHHPVAIGGPSLDAKGLKNWPDLHAVLRRHRQQIRHIFHGHCHMALQGNVEGISFTGIRSMGPQAYTDFKTEKATRWITPPHYAVVFATENAVVSHLSEFGYDGPIFANDRQPFQAFIAACAERGVTVPTSEPIIKAAE